MSSTIHRVEHVLARYSRAKPGATNPKELQWERHQQPTIQLAIDTAKSRAGVLESVRLRITWTMDGGPTPQVVTFEDLDLLAFSRPSHAPRDPRGPALKAVYHDCLVGICYWDPVSAVLDDTVTPTLRRFQMVLGSPDATRQVVRALEVVCSCKAAGPAVKRGPASQAPAPVAPGMSQTFNPQAHTPNSSLDTGMARSTPVGVDPTNHLQSSQPSSPFLGHLRRPISPSPSAHFLAQPSRLTHSEHMPPPPLPSSSSPSGTRYEGYSSPVRHSNSSYMDYSYSSPPSSQPRQLDHRIDVYSPPTYSQSSFPPSRRPSPPRLSERDIPMPGPRQPFSASFHSTSTREPVSPAPIRSASVSSSAPPPRLVQPVPLLPVPAPAHLSMHPPPVSVPPPASPPLQGLPQDQFEELVAQVIMDQGFENLMHRLDAIWRIKGLVP